MLQEIEEMATELPGATLAAAARRLAMLAAASGAQGGHDLTNLPVLELTYDAGAAADEQHDEQADDAQSTVPVDESQAAPGRVASCRPRHGPGRHAALAHRLSRTRLRG